MVKRASLFSLLASVCLQVRPRRPQKKKKEKTIGESNFFWSIKLCLASRQQASSSVLFRLRDAGSGCEVADSIRQGYLCPCLLCSDPTRYAAPAQERRSTTLANTQEMRFVIASPSVRLAGIHKTGCVSVCMCVRACVHEGDMLTYSLCLPFFSAQQTNWVFCSSVFMM